MHNHRQVRMAVQCSFPEGKINKKLQNIYGAMRTAILHETKPDVGRATCTSVVLLKIAFENKLKNVLEHLICVIVQLKTTAQLSSALTLFRLHTTWNKDSLWTLLLCSMFSFLLALWFHPLPLLTRK